MFEKPGVMALSMKEMMERDESDPRILRQSIILVSSDRTDGNSLKRHATIDCYRHMTMMIRGV
jgi:hypothetical protein